MKLFETSLDRRRSSTLIVVGIITRAVSVSDWERQIAFKQAEMAGVVGFGVSLLETRGTGPRLALIANCCGKARYGDVFLAAQS